MTMRWHSLSGGSWDPTTEEYVGGTETPAQKTVRATVYYVSPGDEEVNRYGVLTRNDVIVMFPSGESIDAKAGLYFELEGKDYEVKPHGEDPPESWGAVFGGLRVGRRVALQLKS